MKRPRPPTRTATRTATVASAIAFATAAHAVPMAPLHGPALGGAKPAPAVPASATSSRIAIVDGGALVIDADSGVLIRTDRAGAATATLAIGPGAGTLAYDPVARRAYVADRRGDRIVVVGVGETLAIAATWPAPAEPYGVALAPDRATVLVTAIADRALVAYAAATGKPRWRIALDAEPRGISISADGARAAISSLAVGAIDVVTVADPPRLARVPIEIPDARGQTVARGAFTVQYLGDHLMATALQTEIPVASSIEQPDHYGGGSVPPVSQVLAFVDDRGGTALAPTGVALPRALAWDPAADALYLTGVSSDFIERVDRASQVDATRGTGTALATHSCGADGIALDGGDAVVWCSFTRTVVRGGKSGPELVASTLDDTQHLGMIVFHTADANISQAGTAACASCHVDGRSDGESWLIHGQRLQTPMLAGRLADTAPFKWDGGAKDLPTSIRATVERLGGDGLSKKHIAALTAYLEAMPAVRSPTLGADSVARGKRLFDSAELGCTECHDGAAYTDRARHRFAGGPPIDTPSLRGLAASAPYFHDGSAPTLDAVLRDHGAVHGMASDATGKLADADVTDLRAFLESL